MRVIFCVALLLCAAGATGCVSSDEALYDYSVNCPCGGVASTSGTREPESIWCSRCRGTLYRYRCDGRCKRTFYSGQLAALCVCGAEYARATCPECEETAQYTMRTTTLECADGHRFSHGYCHTCATWRTTTAVEAARCSCGAALLPTRNPAAGQAAADQARYEAFAKDVQPTYDAANAELQAARALLFSQDGRTVLEQNAPEARRKLERALALLEGLRARHAAIIARVPIAMVDPDHLQAGVLHSLIRAQLVAEDRAALVAVCERQGLECTARRAAIDDARGSPAAASLADHLEQRRLEFARFEVDAEVWLGMEERAAGDEVAARRRWRIAIELLPAGDPMRVTVEELLR